jgi:DNA-binding NarL/FixJ family response regulator
MTTRIILIEDHAIVRQGLRLLLERQTDLAVVGEASDGIEGLALATRLNPDLVIVDIGLPGMNGIDVTKAVLGACPATKVLALSMHADRQTVRNMLIAGASGYLLKEVAYEELVEAIRQVCAGQTYLSRQVANLVVQDYVGRAEQEAPRAATLSPREREVWALLVQGLSSAEIAERLVISVRTVESHRQHVMEKLDVHSMAELVKRALREGIITLDD